VGRFVERYRHGSLALAARMGTDILGKGFYTESDIARARPMIQNYLAKCTVSPDGFGLEKSRFREFFRDG